VSRPLTAAGTPVGELTLWPMPGTPWNERDDLAVAAYGVVLASALHDAATQQRLGTVSAQASHQAVHDPLTGLRNRAALLADGAELLRSLDGRHPVALLLIDLNGFSRVNATLGQQAGDQLLQLVGGRLAELAREGELPARLGDDEFALLLPQITVLSDSAGPLAGASSPVPQAMRRAQELVGRLSTPAEIGGIRLSVEAAAGVAVANAGCFDLAELVRRAEIALGAAKSAEVAVVAFDDSHEVASTDHLAMLAELREALAADDQIVLALQPAVDLVTGAPTGVEALSRWEHPRRGSLSPIEFIRVVERSELLGPFTRYVLDRSLAAAASWSAAGLDLPVSVNVAARSLLDRSFPVQVADALRRYGVPSHRLVLEITETLAVSDQPTVDDVVSALCQLGVQLSVDDFGTGYSSLAILERMPVDELKVDRSFVAGMADSPRSAAIVRFAVELGRSLDLRVVAEGVETADQRAALVKLGCATAQGYHFCRPIPADRIVEALRSLSDGAAAARNVVPLRADDAS
jgi:diguanylate cyclase (GGDEF)-like protein